MNNSYWSILDAITSRLSYLRANIERTPNCSRAALWKSELVRLQKMYDLLGENNILQDRFSRQ